MELYYAISPDGTNTKIEIPVGSLGEAIAQHVGSPIDVVRLSEDLHLYIRDDGLFDGSELNVPLAVMMAMPICGPILVAGRVSDEGDSLGVNKTHPFVLTILSVCQNLKQAHEQVAHNREHPFTIINLNTGEEI